MSLHRRFTPLNMLLLSINGTIGSAWLFAPLYAAKIAGSAAVIAWIIGGIATIFIALTFTELSTFIPVAGGSMQLPQLSHGELTSFTMSWIAWLASVIIPPIEVLAILQYCSTYFPSLTHAVNNTHILTTTGFWWAVIIMFGLCILNIISFKGLVRFNQLLFSFKIGVILITIYMIMHMRFIPQNFMDIPHSFFSAAGWHGILSAIATGGIAFAYTGFKHGVELAGETKNSSVAIPVAVVGSVICCLLIYLGLQVAFIGALDTNILQHGWAHISFPGDAGPFVGIAGLLGIVWLVKLLYLDAMVSPMGAGLVFITSSSRIIYAMSKNGFFSPLLSRLNKQNFPTYAIILNFLIGIFLFLPLPGWQAMVELLVSVTVISYAMGPISLLCLRIQLPDGKRPFRLPIANFFCLIAFYFCNLISYWTGWNTLSKLAIALLIGFVFFLIAYWRNTLSRNQLGLKAIFWLVPYLSGLVLISYLGAFDGKNIIPFGWDFLVIGIFSIVMLRLAVAVRLEKVSTQYNTFLAQPSEITL